MLTRAVLFDLDGTLLDTLDDLADSMNEVLGEMGHRIHPTDAYRRFVGDGVENLVRRALPEHARSDVVVREGVAEMRRVYSDRWNRKTKPYPGVRELLDALAERKTPTVVLSNKPDDLTRLAVSALLPFHAFRIVRGSLPDVPRKPDPAGALALAGELGIPPADFLYLGDTDTDMQTATRAGMRAVGALWGFRDAAELTANGATVLVAHPAELLDLI